MRNDPILIGLIVICCVSVVLIVFVSTQAVGLLLLALLCTAFRVSFRIEDRKKSKMEGL